MRIFLVYFSFIIISGCSAFHYYGKIDKKFKKLNSEWKLIENQDYKVYFLENSPADSLKDSLLSFVDMGMNAAKKSSKLKEFKKPLKIFLVNSPEDVKTYTDDYNNGNSYVKSNVIIQKFDMIKRSHEYFHIISIQNWGHSHNWVEEGSAVWSDGHWRGHNLHTYCSKLLSKQKLLPLSQLIQKNSFKKSSAGITYPQSGSLIKYLIDTYGWEKYLLLWKQKNLEKVYDKSISEIEKEWLSFIKNK